MSHFGLPRSNLLVTAVNGYGACCTRGHLQSRQYDLILTVKASQIPRKGPITGTLLDACAPILDDTVLQRPRLLVRQLKINVGKIDRMRQHLAEEAVESGVIQATRLENQVPRDAQSIGVGNRSVHGYVSVHYSRN